MDETSIAASLAIDMLQYLERLGHHPQQVCADAAIDHAMLARPDTRLRGSDMERLWQVALSRTGDPLVGAHMSDAFHPAALDILGYVVVTCRTVGDVLDALVRYAGLLNDGLRVELVHDGPRTIVRLHIVESHLGDALRRESRQVVDSMWIGLAKQLRIIGKAPVIPLEVWFRHAALDPPEYRRLLGAPVTFGASEDRVVLARTDLAVPLPTANPALFTVFEQHADQLLARLGGQRTVVGRVARIVADRLRGRVPPIGEVASEMAMSARNLQRALQAEERTYQGVLDDVRAGLARRYLSDESNSVSQVAFLLGFSEAAAFHRAFKRWTGTTPAAARASAG